MQTQFKAEVGASASFHRDVLEKKGSPAIDDGNLTFGSWVANGDVSVVDFDQDQDRLGSDAFSAGE